MNLILHTRCVSLKKIKKNNNIYIYMCVCVCVCVCVRACVRACVCVYLKYVFVLQFLFLVQCSEMLY